MLLNVVRSDFQLNLYAREQSANYTLVVPLTNHEETVSSPAPADSEVVGTVEVEAVLSFGPTGEIEAVRINDRKYTFAGVNPFANKIVFDDGSGGILAYDL